MNVPQNIYSLVVSASQLDACLKAARKTDSGSIKESSSVLSDIFYKTVQLTKEINTQNDYVNVKESYMCEHLFIKIQALLNIYIDKKSTPAEIAKKRFGKQGLMVFNMLKNLGYSEYSLDFWTLLVYEFMPDCVYEYNNVEPDSLAYSYN